MSYSCPVCGKTFGTELPAARHVLHATDTDHAAWRDDHEIDTDSEQPAPAVVGDIWS